MNYNKNLAYNDCNKIEIKDNENQNQNLFNSQTSFNNYFQDQFNSTTKVNKDKTKYRNNKNKKNKQKNKQNRYNNQNINQNSDNNYENNNQINNENNIQNDSEYNNGYDNNINELGFLITNVDNEPKIGLANIGATCYMNATLQCFSHTTKLTNYYLAPKNKNIVTSNQKKFSREYYEVIKKLWIKKYNNNKNFYSPDRFKNILSQMEPLFQGIAANDSKDLVNFILQTLHSELNTANGQNQNNYNVNQLDENLMLNHFLQDYKENQKSIISDIFFGISETKTECLNCLKMRQMQGNYNHVYVHNFQIINFIIFPLEEIRKAKYQNYFNNFFMGNSNEVYLSDCFDYYQKVELMDGENQMYCNYCNSNSPSYYSTTLYSSPQIFILILNRGRGNIYNVKLNFSEIINIGNYVKMKVNTNLIYHLYAIVTHIGPSSMSGHFIAFCKSPIDGKWYKFNDAIVDYVGDFNNNVSNFGTPYILFYERQTL
jgi:ubiquitin carboxyl-terminal hydrolase 2/21